jgi:hypothetical protein
MEGEEVMDAGVEAGNLLRTSPDLVDRLNYRIGVEMRGMTALQHRTGRQERDALGTPSDFDLMSDACTEIKNLRRRILWMNTHGTETIPAHLKFPEIDD